MHHRLVQFVIKTSKKCNLRCQYCYEFAELHKSDAMTLEQIEAMYRHIESYYSQLQIPVTIHFIWHGGEPLLLPSRFYWQALDLQSKIFQGQQFRVINGVQTNLTVLNEEHLLLLKEGFDKVGISVDIFGDLRVYENGRSSQLRVLENIDKLLQRGISFGCITVLNGANINRVEQIYQFYREMGLSARLLPLHKTSNTGQNNGIEIDPYSVLKAFQQIFELWLADEESVWITPVVNMVQEVLSFYNPDIPVHFYDKREWEYINLVNITGDLYSYADAYNIDRSYGNLFNTPLRDLYASPQHNNSIAAAEQRLEQTCVNCKFFGACSGYPIAEDGYEYNEIDENGAIRCIIHKGMLQYIEHRLQEEGVIANGYLNMERLKIRDANTEAAYA